MRHSPHSQESCRYHYYYRSHRIGLLHLIFTPRPKIFQVKRPPRIVSSISFSRTPMSSFKVTSAYFVIRLSMGMISIEVNFFRLCRPYHAYLWYHFRWYITFYYASNENGFIFQIFCHDFVSLSMVCTFYQNCWNIGICSLKRWFMAWRADTRMSCHHRLGRCF